MILHLIMSCNRPEFLMKSLASVHKVNFEGMPVYRVLIDDYPHNRNSEMFTVLARTYAIDLLILNRENLGLSVVWGMLWDMFKSGNYTFVLHQEDDAVLKHPISIRSWIKTLEGACNSVLTRQKWYPREQETAPRPTDAIIDGMRVEYRREVFSPMFSLYRAEIMRQFTGKLNEGTIMAAMKQPAAYVKTPDGSNMIEHVGHWKTGRIITEGEPGWDKFKHYDPAKKYCSITGKQL